MKIHLKRNVEIVQIPQQETNPIYLSEITNSHFVYKITYRVFPTKALMHNSTTCVFQFSKIPFTKTNKKVFDTSDPKRIIQNLLTHPAKQADAIQSEEEQWFFTYLSDFTSRIPNDRLRQVERSSGAQETNELQLVSSRELTLSNFVSPVLDITTSKIKNEEIANGLVLQELAQDLIEKNIDPASYITDSKDTIVSAQKAFGGLSSKNYNGIKHDKNELLVQSLLSTKRQIEDQKDSINDEDLVQVLRTVQRDYIEIVETVEIPKEVLFGVENFYIGFRVLNNNGLIINTTSTTVNHNQLVSNFSFPTKPPYIHATRADSRSNRVIIEVKQNDPNGQAIQVYKRQVSTTSNRNDATYEFVGEIPASMYDGIRMVEDESTTRDHVIYRAVAVNDKETLGAEFNSSVTGPRRAEDKTITIATKVVEQQIRIEIGNIPNNVIAVEILKRDRTIHDKNFSSLGITKTTDDSTNFSIVYFDKDVKLFRVYEYAACLYYRTGASKRAPSVSIIEFNPVNKNIIEVSTTAPIVESDGTNFDVRFNIIKSAVQTDIDAIRSFLNQQGYLGEYQDEIIANREKIQELFGIEIQRTNMSTGEVENFGVVTTDEFSDLLLGPPRDVKPLEAGVKYVYTLRTFARVIETLFTTIERTVETNFNTSYQLEPAKWYHPVTLNLGNIVSDSSLQRNHAKSSFTFGNLGNILEVEVDIPDSTPSISDTKAKIVGKNKIEIQWKVQGVFSKIDHFILIYENMGMRSIIGKSHNISDTGSFKFIHNLDQGQKGRFRYAIVPVDYNFNRGVESKTNYVVVKS